jgi:serine phosphatase RsbU (regulator of sigma subunit)
MTMFAACVDLKEGILMAANAGHNIPYLIRQDDARHHRQMIEHGSTSNTGKKSPPFTKLKCRGLPLGLQDDATYDMEKVPLRPGDKLFAYTDGLFECKGPGGKSWGESRLKRAIGECADSHAEILQKVVGEKAFQHFGDTPRDDDVTIVVMEVSEDWPANGDVSLAPQRMIS